MNDLSKSVKTLFAFARIVSERAWLAPRPVMDKKITTETEPIFGERAEDIFRGLFMWGNLVRTAGCLRKRDRRRLRKKGYGLHENSKVFVFDSPNIAAWSWAL